MLRCLSSKAGTSDMCVCVMMAPSIHLAACMVHACYNVNVLPCSVVEKCFVGMRSCVYLSTTCTTTLWAFLWYLGYISLGVVGFEA